MSTLASRDWANLPPELLETILAHLADIPDRIRFGCVCASWLSASKARVSSASDGSDFPWLLLPIDPSDAAGRRRFFSLSERRLYSLPIVEARMTRTNKLFPSPGGPILTPLSIETLALVNPLTGSSAALPLLPLTEARRKNIGAFVLRRAKVFRSDGVEITAVMFPDKRDLFFWRTGEALWKRIDMELGLCYSSGDFAYIGGRFIVFDNNVETLKIIDAESLEWVGETSIVPCDWICNWIVEWPPGELLLVQKKAEDERKRFALFRLGQDGEPNVWVEVDDIGGNALFVDGLQAMVLASGDLCGWRSNCIYFVDYLPGKKEKGLLLFDIWEVRVDGSPLFSYRARGHWGKAMWFVPSLC